MAECAFPGCLGGEHCVVHLHGLGKPCDWCKGSARRGEYNAKTGAFVRWHPCDRCGATGLKDTHKGAVRVTKEPIDKRGLIQIAGEPAAADDALVVAETEARQR